MIVFRTRRSAERLARTSPESGRRARAWKGSSRSPSRSPWATRDESFLARPARPPLNSADACRQQVSRRPSPILYPDRHRDRYVVSTTATPGAARCRRSVLPPLSPGPRRPGQGTSPIVGPTRTSSRPARASPERRLDPRLDLRSPTRATSRRSTWSPPALRPGGAMDSRAASFRNRHRAPPSSVIQPLLTETLESRSAGNELRHLVRDRGLGDLVSFALRCQAADFDADGDRCTPCTRWVPCSAINFSAQVFTHPASARCPVRRHADLGRV